MWMMHVLYYSIKLSQMGDIRRTIFKNNYHKITYNWYEYLFKIVNRTQYLPSLIITYFIILLWFLPYFNR